MPRTRRPTATAPIALLAIGALVASTNATDAAHASSLAGLRAASLGTWSSHDAPPPPPPPPAPTPLACDDFDDGAGPLHGRTTRCGATWSAPPNWTIAGGTLGVNGPGGVATLATGHADVSVAVDVVGGNANNRRAGVVLSHRDVGPAFLAAVLDGSTLVRLELHQGSRSTVLASMPVADTGTWRISATRSGATVRVVVGAAEMATTLPPATAAILDGTGVGLYKGQGPPATFDRFEVTAAGSTGP